MKNTTACRFRSPQTNSFINMAQQRLGDRYSMFSKHPRGHENSVLQAVSAIFGVAEADDKQRLCFVDKTILPLLSAPGNESILERTIDELPNYAGWTGSGAHRFMPVALAVGNILKGNSIFSQELISSMPKKAREYLRSKHPFYSAGLQDTELPDLRISMHEKEVYSWLDIASAPKTGGAPTLNMLSSCLNKLFDGKFSFHGVDIAFPLYELTLTGEIKPSEYCSEGTQMLKSEVVVKGVTYHNALLDPGFDIRNNKFADGDKFDFISMCMVLPQMAGQDLREIMDFTSRTVSGSTGFDPKLKLAKIQQKVIDAALGRLAVDGIFIGDLRSQLPADMPKEERENENQESLMFIIQRKGGNDFTIFDRFPIVFSTSPEEYLPSEMMGFINGYKHPKPVFNHEGISACYPELSEQQMQSLRDLFISADWLALRHQSWKKSVWGRASAVIEAIKTEKPLETLLEIYLENVPVESVDKRNLLTRATDFDRYIFRRQ